MKNVIKKGASRNAINQLVKLIHDPQVLEFILEKGKGYEKFKRNTQDKDLIIDYHAKLTLQIREFLYDKKLPNSLEPTFFGLIAKSKLPLTLDNGISLFVGNQEVLQNGAPIQISSNPGVKAISSDRKIKIVFTGKFNKSHAKKFIDDNWEKIEGLMDALELPEVKPMPWKDTCLAVTMEYLRIKNDIVKSMTYEEIAEHLQKRHNEMKAEKEITYDANNLKKTSNRYKRYLTSKK